MTTDDRSLERAARSWIETGPSRAPDRVVDAALQQIQMTPQERDLRIPWRLPTMLTTRLALAAAAVVVVLAGALTFTRLASVGPAAPLPSNAASAASTTAPSPTPLNISAGYTNLPGWIVFEHFGRAPDGSSTEFNGDYRTIWLVHADGSGLHELAPGKPAAGKVSPDISPDGTKVVFSSWEDKSRLYEVSIGGGEPVELTAACAATLNCTVFDPAYSPDGKRVAYVQFEFDAGAAAPKSAVIKTLDLTTSTTTVLASTRVDEREAYLTQPSWSPDGTRIVYTRNLQNASGGEHISGAQLFVANADDSGAVQLTPTGTWAADADWSPDGSTIVFSSYPNREGEGWGGVGAPPTGIYSIRPDGTGVTNLCSGCLSGGIAPSWTPDGTHIMFWGYRSWALMKPDGTDAAHINQAKLTWFGDTLGFGYAGFLQPIP